MDNDSPQANNLPDAGSIVPAAVPTGEQLNAVPPSGPAAVEAKTENSGEESQSTNRDLVDETTEENLEPTPAASDEAASEITVEEPELDGQIKWPTSEPVQLSIADIPVAAKPQEAEEEEVQPVTEPLNDGLNGQPKQLEIPLDPKPLPPRKPVLESPVELIEALAELEAVRQAPAPLEERPASSSTPAKGKGKSKKAGPVSSHLVPKNLNAIDLSEAFQTDKTSGSIGDSSNSPVIEEKPVVDPISLAVDAEQLLQVASDGDVAPSDGIEILVRLAHKGDIDPKNVDIIDVTDKFLKLIAAAPKENLRQSGKILFHACVLLRMKAEALLNFTAEDPSGDDFLDFDDNGDAILYDSNEQEVGRQITLKDLEKAIVRRSQRRQIRKRQVTLDELIEALREAERIEKTRSERKPARAVIELAGQHDVDGVDDLLDLAHDEDVETTIEKVEILLAKILKLGEKIELFRMVVLMEDHSDWVDAFLASLFLSNAGKIDLYQDEFYGPLYIALGGSSASNTVVM